MMGTPIPSLRGTSTHVKAVELYQGHHGDGGGECVRCGARVPCPTRAHAASVIAAAGEDPRWYDGRLAPGVPAGDVAEPAGPDLGDTYAKHTGFRVGGRDVRHNPAGHVYESAVATGEAAPASPDTLNGGLPRANGAESDEVRT